MEITESGKIVRGGESVDIKTNIYSHLLITSLSPAPPQNPTTPPTAPLIKSDLIMENHNFFDCKRKGYHVVLPVLIPSTLEYVDWGGVGEWTGSVHKVM